MKLEDLPDDFTTAEFLSLDKPGLDAVPYDLKKWVCQCKGCTRGTTIRDYGLAPLYWLNRNSKSATANPRKYWSNLDYYFWLCGKHNRLRKRLLKSFSGPHVDRRLLDRSKQKIVDIG